MKILLDHNMDPAFYKDLSDKLDMKVHSAGSFDFDTIRNGKMLAIAERLLFLSPWQADTLKPPLSPGKHAHAPATDAPAPRRR